MTSSDRIKILKRRAFLLQQKVDELYGKLLDAIYSESEDVEDIRKQHSYAEQRAEAAFHDLREEYQNARI